MLVVRGSAAVRAQVQASGLSEAIAEDHIEKLAPNASTKRDLTNSSVVRSRTTVGEAASKGAAAAMGRTTPRAGADPAFANPGLMWSIERIHGPEAWQVTTGDSHVKVGVADTGLDFTHSDLAPRISSVVDFTVDEDPPICSTYFANPFTGEVPGIGDKQLAAMSGGPEKTDWNGHGSWIGGNIAAALDGQGVNGIARRSCSAQGLAVVRPRRLYLRPSWKPCMRQ
jgi:hypothetical protein